MYILSKHFDFTEDELEVICNSVVTAHENLEVWRSEHGITDDEDVDYKLSLLESIIEKIAHHGIFLDDE